MLKGAGLTLRLSAYVLPDEPMTRGMTMICKSWLLTKHKALDMDIHVLTPSRTEPTRLILGADVDVSWNCDHAGATLTISLIFVWFNLCFYDTRHREGE